MNKEEKLIAKLEETALELELLMRNGSRNPEIRAVIFALRSTGVGRRNMQKIMQMNRDERTRNLENPKENNKKGEQESPGVPYTEKVLKSMTLRQLKEIARDEYGFEKVSRKSKNELIEIILDKMMQAIENKNQDE